MLSSLFTNLGVVFKDVNACRSEFFGFKAWFHYLDTTWRSASPPNNKCDVENFDLLPKDPNVQSDLFLILLAMVDNLLRFAGIIAIVFIIYGGFLYIMSQGSPDQASKAQSTIQNSVIGLLIAIVAIGIVSFIGSRIV